MYVCVCVCICVYVCVIKGCDTLSALHICIYTIYV